VNGKGEDIRKAMLHDEMTEIGIEDSDYLDRLLKVNVLQSSKFYFRVSHRTMRLCQRQSNPITSLNRP
jgi:hypothetical protein